MCLVSKAIKYDIQMQKKSNPPNNATDSEEVQQLPCQTFPMYLLVKPSLKYVWTFREWLQIKVINMSHNQS